MTLTLSLPPELEQYLIQQAQQQGLSVETYTVQLIKKSIFQLEKNSFEETPTEIVIEGIHQGIKEALSGQTIPLSQMWEAIEIAITPRFQRDLRELAKRYRSIRSDIQPLIDQLQAGEIPGDRIAGIKYQVFKVRVKNSNIQKGKSGGYRVIYYLKNAQGIILTTIYSKSDLTDVSNEIIEQAIAQYEEENTIPDQ
ncbi:MAG: hypothetical protein RLZZ86_3895 [Cyanobacteriota bacterium]